MSNIVPYTAMQGHPGRISADSLFSTPYRLYAAIGGVSRPAWAKTWAKSTMQHTFCLHKHSIRISATHGGVQYRKATGLTVADVSLWNPKAQNLRARCRDARILPRLLEIHSRLCEAEITARTAEDVLAALDFALAVMPVKGRAAKKKAAPKHPTFWQYFDEWGRRESTSQRQRELAARTVARFMGRDDDWDDVDSAYWLTLNRRMEDAGFSVNYRWNIGSRLKCVMHEGYKLKYHRNDDFRDFRLRKERTDAVALTPAEMEAIRTFTPRNVTEAKARDLAILGYYSASRFSDYSRLTLDNIRCGRLEFTQKKTGDRVVMPASPYIAEVLERNGGRAPSLCQQKFNEAIKVVARDAGVAGVIEIRGRVIPRWAACQSHTFRRSAITALYLSGVSAKDCAYISGHKHLSSFEVYVKTSKDEAAERMAGNAFFR